MMTGNACVVFLILGNKNWENLVLLMVVGLSLIFLHLSVSPFQRTQMMTEAQLIVVFFGVLMCAMSLVASYFEAKEKSKAVAEDAGL